LQPLRAERRDLERQFRGTAQELCRSFRPAPPAPTRGKAKDKGPQKGGRRKGTSGRAGPRLRRPPPRHKPRPMRHKPLGRSRRTWRGKGKATGSAGHSRKPDRPGRGRGAS
jgi:hypothetical protein